MGCISTKEVFLQDAPKLEIAPAVKDCPDVNITDVKLSEGTHSTGFIFVQHLRGFLGSCAIWKIAFYPRLDKCHRRSQIFPVAFRRF